MARMIPSPMAEGVESQAEASKHDVLRHFLAMPHVGGRLLHLVHTIALPHVAAARWRGVPT